MLEGIIEETAEVRKKRLGSQEEGKTELERKLEW